MIELRDVWKGFGTQHVLEGITLQVRDGEKLCIIGESGSGKSVLSKVMTGILEPDRGEIWIDGENVTGFDAKDWRRVLYNFGVVFQSAALFSSLTVFENVGMRLLEERLHSRAEIKDMVTEALVAVGLDAGSVLGKYPAELSGGMQKRVGVARAIVHRPRYVFYDEPTTGLDPINSDRIDELIDRLSREPGRTSVIVTHDMYTVKTIATLVAFLHNRRLHFVGTPAELLASPDPHIQKFLSRSLT